MKGTANLDTNANTKEKTTPQKRGRTHKYPRPALSPDEAARWQAFGAWLRAEREAHHKTRVEVCAQVGIHPVQLARIETGESRTRREVVEGLADAIGFDKTEGLDRAGFAPAGDPSPVSSRLYSKLRTLPPERQVDIEAMIDVFLLMHRTHGRPVVVKDARTAWIVPCATETAVTG